MLILIVCILLFSISHINEIPNNNIHYLDQNLMYCTKIGSEGSCSPVVFRTIEYWMVQSQDAIRYIGQMSLAVLYIISFLWNMSRVVAHYIRVATGFQPSFSNGQLLSGLINYNVPVCFSKNFRVFWTNAYCPKPPRLRAKYFT